MAVCAACGASILRARNEANGTLERLDGRPDPDGPLMLVGRGLNGGMPRVRYIRKENPGTTARYRRHECKGR